MICLLGVLSVAMPASASAAQRFASPTGAGNPAVCAQANPCALAEAIQDASVNDGDEVVVLPGTYDVSVPGGPAIAKEITVHGATGQPRPVITSSNVGPTLFVNNDGAVARDLKLEYTGPDFDSALVITAGTAERIEAVVTQGASACRIANGALLAIRDSICLNKNTAPSVGVSAEAGTGTVVNARLVNVTAVGVAGIVAGSLGTGLMTLSVSNSIGKGSTGSDVVAQRTGSGSATINLDHSNYDTVEALPPNSVTPAGTATNQTAVPVFINAAGDNYHQAAGSPTINAGDMATPGLGLLDVDDQLRVEGPQVDIGADEADTVAPTVVITGGPSGTTGESRPTFTFFAEAGATVECSIDSDTTFRACSAAASDTPASPLASGAHVFRVRATDATGNRAIASRQFTVEIPGVVTAIAPTASGKKKITLDTGSTATCPPGATSACALSGEATAKLPKALSGKAAKTLGSIDDSLAAGQTSAPVSFKVSKKLSKAWRAAGKLKVSISIELAVPGGDAAAQSATQKIAAPQP